MAGSDKINDRQLMLFPLASPAGEQANGGGFEGASRLDRDLMSWYPSLLSADQAILPQKNIVDARALDMQRNDAFAMAAATKWQDSIVGPQFRLIADPDWKCLPAAFDETWADEFQEEAESQFTLWAESLDCWADASGMNTLTGLIRLAVGGPFFFQGEILATAEWIRDGRPFSTALQLVDPARLSNPGHYIETKRFRGGILKNQWGRPVRYFIRNSHPYDVTDNFDDLKWRPVDTYKPWGRKQVIHIVAQHQVGQSRGVAKMVSALKSMRTRKKLNDVELQNVVLNAMYAATIESDLPPDVVASIMGQETEGDNRAFTNLIEQYKSYYGGKYVFMDGVRVPILPPGSKLHHQRNAATANPQFSFEKSLNREMARSVDLSYEEFTGDFTETNYSSARAAMGESWKMYQSNKATCAGRLASEVYLLWLEEAISKGTLSTMPRGFGVADFHTGLYKTALGRCRWLGAPRPEIDPKKEREADGIGLANSTHTLEEVCAKGGKDWRDVVRQKAREKKFAESLSVTLDYSNGRSSGAMAEQPEPEDATNND